MRSYYELDLIKTLSLSDHLVGEKRERVHIAMEIFMIMLILLASGGIACLGILFLTKRKNTAAGRMIEPQVARGLRYRDGAITYNQFDGKRYNIELDIPDGEQSARYQRRHARRQHKQAKPWEK